MRCKISRSFRLGYGGKEKVDMIEVKTKGNILFEFIINNVENMAYRPSIFYKNTWYQFQILEVTTKNIKLAQSVIDSPQNAKVLSVRLVDICL